MLRGSGSEDECNYLFEKQGTPTKHIKGLSIFATTLFIVGEMAGSGVLALPRAIANTGYIGLTLLVIFCINAAYGGTKLGACWNIVEERYPEHRKSTRNPYAVIAEKAIGPFGGVIVSNCIRITLFGAGTVYLILASQIIQELINNVLVELSFCSYFVMIAAVIVLPMWLGSPKEFSLVGTGAMLTTVLACFLYFVQIVRDVENKNTEPRREIHGFQDFFLSFGTLLFAFGGASTFPTIQNDMENKKKFSTSIIIAFSIILLLYFPISLGGFLAYGEDVRPNVTMSLTNSTLVTIGNVFIAIHLVFAFLIVMNPVCQDLEEAFKIPKHFNWKRCLVRTTMVMIMVLIGEMIPEFGKILSLIGGSTITLLTFVLPPFFYMKLCNKKEDGQELNYRNIPFFERVYMWELIIIGIVGGCASTFSAIYSIVYFEGEAKSCFI